MTIEVHPHFVPTTPADLAACLANPVWRVCSGQLYKILVKSADEDGGFVMPFHPNRTQMCILNRLWTRNLILKARQVGVTSLIAILWLDHALFNADQRCGIIAQDVDAATGIFRDKVRFAYDRLPKEIREARPLKRDSAVELLFSNNSSIRVATSMRSGTINRLHVSEFGKIGAKYPDKATEVVTGSLPAVPLDGVVVIESTAEGADGEFHAMTMRALAQQEQGKELSERDYAFHFFPWFVEPGYRMQGDAVCTDDDRAYFAKVEAEAKTSLDDGQRKWYLGTRDNDFSGDAEKMWREYPSTAREAFSVSIEGTYFGVQLSKARIERRIGRVPYVDGLPVDTCWDIGSSDGTAIWLHQRLGVQHRFVGFIEGWGEGYSYYVSQLQRLGYVWGDHYLPHDAAHERQQQNRIASPLTELQELRLGGTWIIVPPVTDINHGIMKARSFMTQCWFDEERCKPGLIHLSLYRKRWNQQAGGWTSTPRKDDGHSEAADAYRQIAQGYLGGPRASSAERDRPARRLAGGMLA